MARLARIVVPGYPHHVTQRGSRRQITFFQETDYSLYLTLMSKWCRRYDVAIWAYCLMPNHVHLVAVPSTEDGLAKAVGSAHRAYALKINEREKWTGHLWQERFSFFVMDEPHLLAAVRYVELNPVRAGLVENAADYRWSSSSAHFSGNDDVLVQVRPMLERISLSSWEDYLAIAENETSRCFQESGKSGRPLGSDDFIASVEKIVGRSLRPRKRGRKKK